MGNGGSPPAHLPSSTATDNLWYPGFADFPSLAAKWMQPPARAPKWMDEWIHGIWDILGTPDDWLARGMNKDLASTETGELPWPRPDSPDEAAYQAWKRAVDDMWLSHAALNAHHTIIEKRATLKLALAREVCQQQELSAACTIFLWLRRRRLHTRLARQTSRQQLREAALARLRYEQECSKQAALAEKQRLAAATARAKRLADEAVVQRIWEALAEERCRHEADMQRL